jgi:hypothetical protein
MVLRGIRIDCEGQNVPSKGVGSLHSELQGFVDAGCLVAVERKNCGCKFCDDCCEMGEVELKPAIWETITGTWRRSIS